MKDPLKGASGFSLFTFQFQAMPTDLWSLTSAGLNEVSTKTADSDAAVLSKNCTTDTHSNFNWASGGSTKNRLYTRAFHFVPAKQPQFSTENIFSLQFNFRFFEMFSSFLLESSFLQSPHSIFPILSHFIFIFPIHSYTNNFFYCDNLPTLSISQ